MKLALIPSTYGMVKKFDDKDFIKLTINTSIDDIDKIMDEYKISKRKTGIFNASVLTFSNDMLIPQKYQLIISKPENTTLTKDLVDLFFLTNHEYDVAKISKWIIKKWSKQTRNPIKNKEDMLNIIKGNKDKELTKIKLDWEKNNINVWRKS